MGIFEKNAARDLGWEYISLSTGNDDEGIFYCEKDNAIGSVCMFSPLAGWDDKTPGAAATLLNESGWNGNAVCPICLTLSRSGAG